MFMSMISMFLMLPFLVAGAPNTTKQFDLIIRDKDFCPNCAEWCANNRLYTCNYTCEIFDPYIVETQDYLKEKYNPIEVRTINTFFLELYEYVDLNETIRILNDTCNNDENVKCTYRNWYYPLDGTCELVYPNQVKGNVVLNKRSQSYVMPLFSRNWYGIDEHIFDKMELLEWCGICQKKIDEIKLELSEEKEINETKLELNEEEKQNKNETDLKLNEEKEEINAKYGTKAENEERNKQIYEAIGEPGGEKIDEIKSELNEEKKDQNKNETKSELRGTKEEINETIKTPSGKKIKKREGKNAKKAREEDEKKKFDKKVSNIISHLPF
uniref:Uncharacterized protein n=1 Tax=Meloidogyne hapla TaxID=6305 RepID=A0A1I8C2F2_MELHA